jgi:hypothetical protein
LSAKIEELETQLREAETQKENELLTLHQAISELKQQLAQYQQNPQPELTAN